MHAFTILIHSDKIQDFSESHFLSPAVLAMRMKLNDAPDNYTNLQVQDCRVITVETSNLSVHEILKSSVWDML